MGVRRINIKKNEFVNFDDSRTIKVTNPLNPNYAKNIEERAISKSKEEKLESQVFDYSAGESL